MREAVNSHALPVHEKNRITSLLCIFETTFYSANSVYLLKLIFVPLFVANNFHKIEFGSQRVKGSYKGICHLPRL